MYLTVSVSCVFGRKSYECQETKNKRKPLRPVQITAASSEDTSVDQEQLRAQFRAELGRATWKLLHTIAAKYPDYPDPPTKQQHEQFLQNLGHIYPCSECASHFRKMMQEFPPKLVSQRDFSQWLCEIHNKVNKRLQKPEFPCLDVDSHYDCGCILDSIGDEEEVSGEASASHDVKPSTPLL